MSVVNYDPKLIVVTFGPILLDGFAPGTYFTAERNEDSFSIQVGVRGDACRSKTNNKSGRFTCTLGQWSLVNDELSAIMNLDELTSPGTGIFPMIAKDLNGTTLCAAEKAWIVKPPAVSYAAEAESREWIFETDLMSKIIGGHII